MKDRKLAMRYARALLSVFDDITTLERIDAFLASLAAALETSADLRRSLLDPAVPRPARRKVLGDLAEQSGLPAMVGRFLGTLVDHNRLAVLPTVAAVFHEERERSMGIVSAELTTAAPLGPDVQERARAAIARLTGSQVRLICRVEPQLIGGAVTRIGSTIYDGSLRTQLDRLRRRMVAGS